MSNPVDVQSLCGLRDGQSGMAWLQILAQSNVRRSDGVVAERAFALAGRIDQVDEEIDATRTDDRFFYQLPPGWWMWVPILYFGAVVFAGQWADSDMRILVWMWILVAFGGVAITFLAKKYGKEGSLALEKVRRRSRLKGERAALMVELLKARDELVDLATQANAASKI